MTPEEAIEIIKCAREEVEFDYPLDYTTAFEKTIDMLEKQIPKKPKIKGFATFCAGCGGYIIADPFSNFCKRCGQKIDWSEE